MEETSAKPFNLKSMRTAETLLAMLGVSAASIAKSPPPDARRDKAPQTGADRVEQILNAKAKRERKNAKRAA